MQQPNYPAVDAPTDLSKVRIALMIGQQIVHAPADGLGSAFLGSNLTSWAAITRAAGFDTFVATPTSANLRALLTDETGTGAAYFVGGALGTPASGTATNLTGLPISSGVSGLGTGVATFLATPSSANLAAALTDESGSGVVPFQETGTWTPAYSASGSTFSYASRSGTYTKNGRLVHITGAISLNTSGNTLTANAITVTGLPFASNAAISHCIIRHFNTTSSYVELIFQSAGSTTVITPEGKTAAATSFGAVNANQLCHATNGTVITFSMVYIT